MYYSKTKITQVVDALEKEGLFDAYRKDGDKFKFVVPENLMFVAQIYPRAFAHYLPIWLKEEFAKRTDKKFVITSLGMEVTCDAFLDESVVTHYMVGKVRVENEF